MGWTEDDRAAPSLGEIQALAEAARDALPEAFRPAARGVAIRVEDVAPDGVLDELGIEDGFGLTGLYEGIPLTEKSVMDSPGQPDVIWLYRRALLDEWAERGNVGLRDLVAHVLVVTFFPYVAESWATFEGSTELSGLPGKFIQKSVLLVFALLLPVAVFFSLRRGV